MRKYQVVVGNIGTVYDGNDKRKAAKSFREYKNISKDGHGRAGNEPVHLFHNGDVAKEWIPPGVGEGGGLTVEYEDA